MNYDIGVIVGSLSENSINRKLALAIKGMAPANLELREIPIKDLPLYNHDVDEDYPAVGREFKKAVEDVDALVFVTPEYNRSIPGSLKNAIDWGSRPWGTNSFAGKPSAVIGTSPGKIGTAVAQQHLRSILSSVNSPELAQPEAYIQYNDQLFAEDGSIADESTRNFVGRWLNAFEIFVGKVVGAYKDPDA